MKRFFSVALLAAASSLSIGPAQAESWIFGPSYYSHTPNQPVQVGPRRLTGGPYYTRPQGGYFNGGYRNLRSFINVHGQTVDQYQIFESWGQVGSQM